MSYFTYIPSITYWNKLAPDIMTRAALTGNAINNVAVYHPYTVEDGDRPDTLAYYYYGDTDLDWLILLANNIVDYTSQWPLITDDLNNYIALKYGNINATYTTIDHYKLVTPIMNIDLNTFQNLPVAAQKYWAWNSHLKIFTFIGYAAGIIATPESYALMNVTEKTYWRPIYQYDNEFSINERKRKIKLIDRGYANTLRSALQNAMQT